MGDVVHGLGGEQAERLGLDLEEGAPGVSKVDTPSVVTSR